MLSQSVATAIKLRGGDEASETAKFVEMCDKWFDAMNVHNYTQGILVSKIFNNLTHEYNYIQGIRTRKDFQRPYTSADDERLKLNIFYTIIFNSELI